MIVEPPFTVPSSHPYPSAGMRYGVGDAESDTLSVQASEGNGTRKPPPSEFGPLVRELRMKQGMTQARLHRESGLSDSYINMLESGARGQRITRDTVVALADGLRATPAERNRLLIAAGIPLDGVVDGPSFEEFVNQLVHLRPNQKQILIDLYRTFVGPPKRGR